MNRPYKQSKRLVVQNEDNHRKERPSGGEAQSIKVCFQRF